MSGCLIVYYCESASEQRAARCIVDLAPGVLNKSRAGVTARRGVTALYTHMHGGAKLMRMVESWLPKVDRTKACSGSGVIGSKRRGVPKQHRID
jgi:hypothetical protein